MTSSSSADDFLERELKFHARDLAALRFSLEAEGAERLTDASLEENCLLDREGLHEARGEVVRLRVDGSGASLTYKGTARFVGELKERTEVEVGLIERGPADDAQSPPPGEERSRSVAACRNAAAILQALGYEEQVRYQKVREEWLIDEVVVALDHTPMGDFVEFEGSKAERVARRFGYAASLSLRESYLELWREYRATHRGPDGEELSPDMVFRDVSEARWPI